MGVIFAFLLTASAHGDPRDPCDGISCHSRVSCTRGSGSCDSAGDAYRVILALEPFSLSLSRSVKRRHFLAYVLEVFVPGKRLWKIVQVSESVLSFQR